MVSTLLGGSDGHGIPVWFSSSPSSSAPMTYSTSTRHASPSGRVLGARRDERLAARVSSSDTNGRKPKGDVYPAIVSGQRPLTCHECRGRAATPPGRRTRQAGRGPGPLFLSYWNVDLICGSCSFVLVAGAPSSVSLRDAVLVCPACDAPNETWDAHDRRATTPTSTSGCRGVDDALRDGVVRTLSPADSVPRMCASSVARATRCRT